MLIPEVRHVDRRRYPAAAPKLPAWPGVNQRPVRSRGHPVLAVHQELSGGGAHRVQRLRVAVLRDAGVDLDQGSQQGCRPAQRARVGPPRGSEPGSDQQQQEYVLVIPTRATGHAFVAPDTFDAEIVRKHATNGSDVQFLKKKFRETFHALMRPAQKIELSNIPGPTSHQWQLFLTATLPACPRLVHVDLRRKEAIRGATLQPFASLRDTLEHLDVSMSAGFGGNLEPLLNLRKLKNLLLYGCVALEGSVEPLADLQDLEMVDVEACFGLVGGLEALSPLPQLKNLNVCDTQLNPAAFMAARRRWWEFGSVVGGCRVGRYGDAYTPLFIAAYDGQAELARRLLVGRAGRAGVEVDRAETRGGCTPVFMAAGDNFPEVAEVLLEHLADVNKTNLDGCTPLSFAAQNGNVQLVNLLLQRGVDVNRANAGQTPLYMAAGNGHKEVVATLLAAGSDKTVLTRWGTALSRAQELNHHEVVALLQ